MPSKQTQRLRRKLETRNQQRDRQVRAVGRRIDAWTRSLEERLLGIIAANRGGVEGVRGSVAVVLIGALEDGADVLRKGLRDMALWSAESAGRAWVEALPLKWWVRRAMPVKAMIGVEGYVTEQATTLDAEYELQRIIDGEVTGERALEIIRQVEFPPPTPEEIDAVLGSTNAPDGLDAMARIKTVGQEDIGRLRELIVEKLSGDFQGASAVESMAKLIRPLVGNDPGKSTGMNYRAKRIARTEGTRIAEAMLRKSWEVAEDIIQGIRTFTAGDEFVRDEHRHWNNKLFYRTSGGGYVARDGERLPEFPAAPNCRCWSTPELIPDIADGLPDVDYGAGYEKGLARFQGER